MYTVSSEMQLVIILLIVHICASLYQFVQHSSAEHQCAALGFLCGTGCNVSLVTSLIIELSLRCMLILCV